MTVSTTQATRAAQGGNLAKPAINAPTNATIQITDKKLYAPVVKMIRNSWNN